MSRMTKPLLAAIIALLLAAPFSWAGGSSDKPAAPKTQGASSAQTAPTANPYFTGDGGKGKSITILPPKGVGLAESQAYLPNFVANELVSNFGGFSAMTLFDRVNNQKQYDELLSGFYADDDAAGLDLGHLASTDYMLLGDITRTTTGYALQLTVNRNSDKTTAATYSATVSVADLDNLTGVRRASLDLLQKMGVQVTERGRAELGMAATEQRVNAQTAAARGIVAQHMGNAAEAMAQFYQAAAYDPSIAEAAARANTMSASVRTGSLGTNIRNDIAWRDEWVKILADARTALQNLPPIPPQIQPPSPPQQITVARVLVPEPQFQQGAVDYNARTAVLSVNYDVSRSLFPMSYPYAYKAAWDAYTADFKKASTARADVYNKIVNDLNAGLDATGRNADWKLSKLGTISPSPQTPRPPRGGVVTISAVVELLNDQGRVIGDAINIPMLGRFGFRDWETVLINRTTNRQLAFTVKADDIGDQMSLRLTATADPAPNNIVQVMTFAELKAASPGVYTTFGAINPRTPQLPETFEMVRINGGTFQMGSDSDNEKPVHTVTVSSFYIGKCEVTLNEWSVVMGYNPGSYDDKPPSNNIPVESGTWFTMVEYCNVLSQREGLTPAYTITDRNPSATNHYPVRAATVTWNRNANGYRLPTEAEWEYAARGGNGTPGNYTYAGSNNAGDVAWYGIGSSSRYAKPVGTKKPNGLGLYDMSGNAWEWCWDRYGTYPSAAQTDPTGPSSGNQRVMRGGSCRTEYSSGVSSTVRAGGDPGGFPSVGFRLARNAQ